MSSSSNNAVATEPKKKIQALLQAGMEHNGNGNFDQAQILLDEAYQLAKSELNQVCSALSEIKDEKYQSLLKGLKETFQELRRDAAYFSGVNYFALHQYAKSRDLLNDALLHSTLTTKDSRIQTSANLYKGIALKNMYIQEISSETTKEMDMLLEALQCLYFSKEALSRMVNAGENSFQPQLGLAYMHLVQIAFDSVDDQFREYITNAISIFSKLEDHEEELAIAYYASGENFFKQGKYNNALKEFEKALPVLKNRDLHFESSMANMYYDLCKYYTDKQNLEETTQNIITRFEIAGQQTNDTYETTTIIMNGLLVLLSVMTRLEDHKVLELIKSWYNRILNQSSNDLIQNLHYDLRDCIIHRLTIPKQIRNILIEYMNITEQVAKDRSIELIKLITNREEGLTKSVSKAIIKLFRTNPINHDDRQALVSSLEHICLFSSNRELNVTLKTLSQILANPDRTASLAHNVNALSTNAQELASKFTFYIRAGKEAILILERQKSPSISSTPLVATFDKEMSIRNMEKASTEAKEKTPDDLQKQGPAPKANQ